MNLNLGYTTLQSSGSSTPLFGDYSLLCEGETALPGFLNQQFEEPVLVNPSVIRTYQQIIFRLEMQVLHYKTLLSQLARRTSEPSEDTAQLSIPINEASVRTVNSILGARIPNESILRAPDEEEI